MSVEDKIKLGKIGSVRLGSGGYDGAMFGLTVSLDFGSSGCSDFKGTWTRRPDYADYTVEQWEQTHADTGKFIRDLMSDAKVDDFTKLAGKPVEVKFEGVKMVSWRILTEVL